MGVLAWVVSLLDTDNDTRDADVRTSTLPDASAHESSSAHQRNADHANLEVWPEGLIIFGEFIVKRVVGTGGSGPVYLVESTDGDRRVIIKRLKFTETQLRSRCVRDLNDWLYLPEHPHLTALQFVRTVEDEADLFIEYVPGTSLKRMMLDGKLYEGGAKDALKRMLDIAIQTAWALRAMHELKVMHGNLKPENILVTGGDHVRLTDLGLDHAATDVEEHDGVSTFYQAPEHDPSETPTVASEAWNWGVVALEMFLGVARWSEAPEEPEDPGRAETEIGEEGGEETEQQTQAERTAVFDRTGAMALEALQAYESEGARDPSIPAMPKGMADVLRKCFQQAAGARWRSLCEVSKRLREIYAEKNGEPYPRRMPALLNRSNQLSIAHARWFRAGGVQWTDPREWIAKGRRAAGELVDDETPLPVKSSCTRSIQAARDLSKYEEARATYEDLVGKGNADLLHELALLLVDNAFLHVSVDDLSSGLETLERAIGIWERLVHEADHRELANDLAMAYLHKATALKNMGRGEPAIEFYDRAIETWQGLMKDNGWKHLGGNLGWAQALRAEVLLDLSAQAGTRAYELARKASALKDRAECLAEQEARAKEKEADSPTVHINDVKKELGLK